ncbi:MAG: AAA family ATPase [Victivallales bacterium]|nr:AAA family ATPase [Victivallales bacterium]
MDNGIKTIPYGINDFENLRQRNGFFVDNTWGIPLLEELPYQMFLRPRRFGKSLLLSILHYYYDVKCTERFDELFGGTWIHEHPTPDRGKYLVMHFDFSEIVGKTLEDIQRNFDVYCKTVIDMFRIAYGDFIPANIQAEMMRHDSFQSELNVLTLGLPIYSDYKIYILIDEYDNFSNRLLTQAGEEEYRALCHGDGFFKSFFALLKAKGKVIQRILFTGVSPMTLDDVTSGFNIAENISQDSQLATLCGFTHKDVRAIMDYYAEAGMFSLDRDQAFRLMTDWYDNYCFSEDCNERVCNPVMLFGFMRNCMSGKHFPRVMVDENLRTDYNKLRHIVTTNGRLNGKFNALERLVTDGSVTTTLIRSFQADALIRPESFVSLLFYYGMVTIDGVDLEGDRMVIPNQTMRQFISDLLLNGYKDASGVDPRMRNIADLLGKMAKSGAWRPVIEACAQLIKETLSVRDLLDGEKAVQASLAAFLSMGSAFVIRTEHQAGFGFADLSLAPRIITFPDIQYAALIEVKYFKKGEIVTDETRASILTEAKSQLERYAADRNLAEAWCLRPTGTVELIRLAVVFHGEELLFAEEI